MNTREEVKVKASVEVILYLQDRTILDYRSPIVSEKNLNLESCHFFYSEEALHQLLTSSVNLDELLEVSKPQLKL